MIIVISTTISSSNSRSRSRIALLFAYLFVLYNQASCVYSSSCVGSYVHNVHGLNNCNNLEYCTSDISITQSKENTG